MSTLQSLVLQVLGNPPLGYEYLVYKTACILLVGFCAGIFAILLSYQWTFSRGGRR